jgi:hypothetical protein
MSYISDAGFGVESALNTTTTALGASAVFTGIAEKNPFSDVMASCYSDTAGTLFFDFSVNGTDWRPFPVAGYSVAAGIHEFHTAVKGPRFFRVRFVNSASIQSTFQLSVYYGTFRLPTSPLNQAYALDASASITRSSFTWLDSARGLTSGLQPIKKFGRNDSVGTSFEPICFGGIYQTPQSGSATTLRIAAGGNANDSAAGSGAREVTIEGLDQDFNYVEEAIATNGTSASLATVATFTRVFKSRVSKSGTYATSIAGSHAGNIVIENSGGGTTWLVMDSAGFPKSSSEVGAYTVAAGKTGYVKIRNLSIDSGKTIDLVFFSRENADEVSPPYSPMRAQSVVSGVSGGSIEVFGDVDVPFGPYVGPTDIGFMARVTAGNASVAIEFEIFIIDEG